MSRFRDELKVIPRTARNIAALAYVAATAMLSDRNPAFMGIAMRTSAA